MNNNSKTLFDEMPQGLKEYLDEQIEDGNDIIFSRTEDDIFILVKSNNLRKWFVVIDWIPGVDYYSMTNITGDAWNLLYKHMTEEMNV